MLDTSGAMLWSMPTTDGPVIVVVLELGTVPFTSRIPRKRARDGNDEPAPHRNAPLGSLKPSA